MTSLRRTPQRAFSMLIAVSALAVAGIFVVAAANRAMFLDAHQRQEQSRRSMRHWLRAAEECLLTTDLGPELADMHDKESRGLRGEERHFELHVGKRIYYTYFRVAGPEAAMLRGSADDVLKVGISAFGPTVREERRTAFGGGTAAADADTDTLLAEGHLRRDYYLILTTGLPPRLILLNEWLESRPKDK